MAELTDEQRLHYVQALKENPLLQGFIDEIKEGVFGAFTDSPYEAKEAREQAYYLFKGVQLLEERVQRELITLTSPKEEETQT